MLCKQISVQQVLTTQGIWALTRRLHPLSEGRHVRTDGQKQRVHAEGDRSSPNYLITGLLSAIKSWIIKELCEALFSDNESAVAIWMEINISLGVM